MNLIDYILNFPQKYQKLKFNEIQKDLILQFINS